MAKKVNVNVNGKISIQPQTITDWALATAYSAGDLVFYSGVVYMANGDVTANTAWATGTTGATWSTVHFSAGDILIYKGNVYTANGDIVAGTAWATGTTGATWTKTMFDGRSQGSVAQVAKGGVNTLLFRTTKGRVFGAGSSSGRGDSKPGSGCGTVNTPNDGRRFLGFQGMTQVHFYDPAPRASLFGTAPLLLASTKDANGGYEETGTITWIGMHGHAAYALFDNGHLWVWGMNSWGQLGLGSTTHYGSPKLCRIDVAEVYTHPESSSEYSYGDRARSIIRIGNTNQGAIVGEIYGCGYNEQGQLGLGNSTQSFNDWQRMAWCGTFPFSVWNMGHHEGMLVVNTNTAGTEAAMLAGTGDGKIICLGKNGQNQLGIAAASYGTLNNGTTADLTVAWTGESSTANKWRIKYAFGSAGRSADYSNYDWSGAMVMWLQKSTDNTNRIVTCGDNTFSAIGNGVAGGTNPTTPYAVSIDGTTTPSVAQLAVAGRGNTLTCFVRLTTGVVYSWGYSYNGQAAVNRPPQNTTNWFWAVAADSSANNVVSPTTHANLTNIKEIILHEAAAYYEWGYPIFMRKTSSDPTYPNYYMVSGGCLGSGYGSAGLGDHTYDTGYPVLRPMFLPPTVEWAHAVRVFNYHSGTGGYLVIDTKGNWWSWGGNNGNIYNSQSETAHAYAPRLVTPTLF